MHKILVIDDEKDICLLISGILEDEGYEVASAHTSQSAYEMIESYDPDLVIQDIWLQGSDDDGIAVLQKVKQERPDLPFLMISGHGTIETAVSSIKLGAYDFIEKPFKSDRLLLMINRALEAAELRKQNSALKKQARGDIVRLSKYLPENVIQILDKCAKTNSRVFITGEIGTGKSIAAEYLHHTSPRAHAPCIILDCQMPDFENSLPTEQNGTLVLNEVHHLSLSAQAKLLDFLHRTELRILSTSSEDVTQKVQSGHFREDLFYRLNVVDIFIPALRTRKKEFHDLIKLGCDYTFSDMAIAKLLSHRWPGNLRQFHNVLEWISIMHDEHEGSICVDQLPPDFSGTKKVVDDTDDKLVLDERVLQLPLREARERFERYYLLTQVHKFGGNISKTAEFIGMERSALHRKLKSLEVFSDDHQNVA